MNGGNNATGYCWPKRLSIHPDWYNNVYVNDWDKLAKMHDDNFPGMQGMFAFQLMGRVASNTQNNFDDWNFNQSQYWSGHGQNLAGGGVPDLNGEVRPWLMEALICSLSHGQIEQSLWKTRVPSYRHYCKCAHREKRQFYNEVG